ncbi:KAP family P-loop NTPase fold protein [Thalassospira mesophila]|uniref:KAP NTPase domain-containing protein n=1 Tax=Thalassospira mesophila TaxID=1293891 RepID=A0A1Y2L3S2_9PROT|nr:P-loop NTPase fold protein [Thalassospira mesophila]OSQ39817.1 hypothetical protein TMES_07775 [Thalassospira mesophila]
MRMIFPEPDITPTSGFTEKVDIFKRKDFGDRLANLIEKSGGSSVIALDAGWGEGKSTFIKMWRGYLSNRDRKKITSIYFDAFANDYQEHPFLALASEIYQLIPTTDKKKQEKFRDNLSQATKSLTRGAIKVAAKITTAGIVDGSDVDSIEKIISNFKSKEIDEIVDEKLKQAKNDKSSLQKFKNHLTEISQEIGDGSPLIFIIDELDRCRPDFALELLEQIKHLFSVEGITFLLVTNRKQLEDSIRAKYGTEINATNYLNKFVHLWVELPRASDKHNDHGVTFLKYALKEMMETDEKINNTDTIEILAALVEYYKPSFREIERTLTYFSIIMNMSGEKKYDSIFQITIAIVCYFNVYQPNLFRAIDSELTYDQVMNKSRLDKFNPETDPHYLGVVKDIIKYELGDKETKEEIIQKNSLFKNHFGRPHNSVIKEVRSWLSDIKIN